MGVPDLQEAETDPLPERARAATKGRSRSAIIQRRLKIAAYF